MLHPERYTAAQLKNRRAGMPPFPGMSAEDSEWIRERIDRTTLAIQALNDEHIAEMRDLTDRAEAVGMVGLTLQAAERVADRRYTDRLTDTMDQMWSDVERMRTEALSRGSQAEWDASIDRVMQAVVDANYPRPDHRQ